MGVDSRNNVVNGSEVGGSSATHKSAYLPRLSEPHRSPNPSANAGQSVIICNNVDGLKSGYLRDTNRASLRIDKSGFDARESVPSTTVEPRPRKSRNGCGG